jgi:tetratricopeptide (TPR) repeat protein
MGLAKILWSHGEREAAVKCLARVAKVFPVDVASRGLLGQYYLEAGDAETAIGPLQEALPQAEAGTPARQKLTSMLAQALTESASGRAAKGDAEVALQYLDRALALVPTDLNILALKSGVCVQLGNFSGAAEALEKMSSLDPANPTIELSLGDVLYQGGKPSVAREHWQRAERLAPKDDRALSEALDTRLRGNVTAETFQ